MCQYRYWCQIALTQFGGMSQEEAPLVFVHALRPWHAASEYLCARVCVCVCARVCARVCLGAVCLCPLMSLRAKG